MPMQISNLQEELLRIINGLKDVFAGVRSNRPTTKLVEDIKVEVYGQQLPVKQLGSVTISPPRSIQISVWDQSLSAAVVKAVESANVGASVSQRGNIVYVNLPPLTAERRLELVKLVKSMAENYRIRIRSLRDDYNKKNKKAFDNSEISEDDKFRFQEEVQKGIDKANDIVEQLLETKMEELND